MRYVISMRGPTDLRSADNRIQSTREDDVVSNPDWLWPNGKRIAVVFNVCLEAWSDGKAPGISPMGNPLPAGVLDTMAISWAARPASIGCSMPSSARAPRPASWSTRSSPSARRKP